MTSTALERSVRTSALLIAVGLTVQLGSFAWRHPLAFILFGVGGGGLVASGVAVFAIAAFRGRIWSHPVAAIDPP